MDFSSLDMPLKNKKLLQCKYSHESVNKNPLNYIKSEDISRRSKIGGRRCGIIFGVDKM